jgi:outer membrane protein OmpA-like peptidoglycan-associated protein
LDVEGQESGSPLLVHGGKGEVVSGLEILMFEMPDPEAIRGELQGTASSPKFETGAQLNNIFFAHNSYEIEDISIKELNNWVEFLKGRTDVAIELSGHTDSEGDDEFNRQLSERRAQAIARYLINNGVDGLRIEVAGYGESRPVGDNATAEGRSLNRRVEIKFKK